MTSTQFNILLEALITHASCVLAGAHDILYNTNLDIDDKVIDGYREEHIEALRKNLTRIAEKFRDDESGNSDGRQA